jgi:hypothetical protein
MADRASDDAAVDVPFAPPTPRLVRRTIRAADAEMADRRSAAMRRRMRDEGIRLIARSSRVAPDGVIVELVFSPRT